MSELPEPKRLAELEPASRLGRLMLAATRELPSDAQLADLRARLDAVLRPVYGATTQPSSPVWLKLALTGGVAALLAGGALALHGRPAPSGVDRTAPAASASAQVSGAGT